MVNSYSKLTEEQLVALLEEKTKTFVSMLTEGSEKDEKNQLREEIIRIQQELVKRKKDDDPSTP
ncbi:MAG: hypothetical protein ABIR30_07260 [Chitinophagaceae bacterium]